MNLNIPFDTGSRPDLERPPATSPGPARARPARRRQRRRVTPSWLDPLVVGLATLLARLATAATGPTNWDSAQYAAASLRFDVAHGRPQPPGYWLYVEAGKWLHALAGLGTVAALVGLAAAASAAAAAAAVVAGRSLGGRWLGLAAGVTVASSPFAWFDGSIVATYSFDLLAASTLLALALRARPGTYHGVAAAGVLGLLSGFRPTILSSFGLLALVAVVASTRSVRRAAATLVVGAATVAAWFVPMVAAQPGGLSAWLAATRSESAGAANATSVLAHAPGAATNLGTFLATTVVAVAPLAAVAAVAALVGGARRVVHRSDSVAPDPRPEPVRLPWYQRPVAVLLAAGVPAAATVALIQFATGGYLLAYLPAAVLALLVPLERLHARASTPTGRRRWRVVASIAVLAVAAVGVERFVGGAGVLPSRLERSSGGLWLQQPRYQAPYPDTYPAIETADRIDRGLVALAPVVRPGDVLVFDTVDGGASIYRNAGWELPDVRSDLVAPGDVLYQQLHRDLYYSAGTVVDVPPDGTALLVASPALPGVARLARSGQAHLVALRRPIGGYLVFRVTPGASLLGVHFVRARGAEPLGHGI